MFAVTSVSQRRVFRCGMSTFRARACDRGEPGMAVRRRMGRGAWDGCEAPCAIFATLFGGGVAPDQCGV
eukprot:12600141-Alexandrium_andersonii.AAC.1